MNKKAEMGTMGWIFIIGAIAIILTQTTWIQDVIGGISTTPSTPSTPSTPATVVGNCPPGVAIDTTTVTLNAEDAYNSGTAMDMNAYSLTGPNGPWTNLADGSSLTASPGNSLSIMWQRNGTAYAIPETITVPCDGSKTLTKLVYRQHTNLTYKVFNDDDGLLNSVATGVNESMAALDEVNLDSSVIGTSERGMPYGATVVCAYNTTYSFDDIEISGVGIVSGAATPTQYVSEGSGWSAEAYKFPPILGNEKKNFIVMINADDTVGPLTHTADQIRCQTFDWEYFQTDSGAWAIGPEDTDDSSDVGNSENVRFSISIA